MIPDDSNSLSLQLEIMTNAAIRDDRVQVQVSPVFIMFCKKLGEQLKIPEHQVALAILHQLVTGLIEDKVELVEKEDHLNG